MIFHHLIFRPKTEIFSYFNENTSAPFYNSHKHPETFDLVDRLVELPEQKCDLIYRTGTVTKVVRLSMLAIRHNSANNNSNVTSLC